MEYRKLTELKKLPNNPRLIRDEDFKTLVRSIRDNPEYFEARPIILSDRTGELVIIAGNQRYEAAKTLKLKQVPTFLIPDLTEEKEREIIIRDNVANGQWDFDILANEWDSALLTEWGVDLPSDFGPPMEAEEDDYEIPDEIETDIVLGDLFEIGQHRLLCGDSTDSDSVNLLMGGAMADLYITDPPYGVAYTGKTKDALKIQNDAMTAEQTHKLWREAFDAALISLKSGCSIYVTVPPGLSQVGFMQVLLDADCLHQCMVWNKGQLVLGHSDYHYQHEPVLYGWKPGKHYFTKDRTKTTVFDVKKPMRNAEHPTMKPVDLWAEFINNSSTKGSIVLDSFIGSGTTMVACHQLNRKCYGMELDPKYCQVIIDRMRKLDPDIEIKKNGGKL
jgi:DNA modification methylase